MSLPQHRIRRCRRAFIAVVALTISLSFTLPAESGRLVVLSDIHGEYQAMNTLLTQTGIIDDSGRWSANSSQLVIAGDVLDRGSDSRKILDLLMRLERDAPAYGGVVHMLLGNHEVMNLVGDLRYVSADEFAAFSAEEDPALRDAAFDALRSRSAQLGAGTIARPEFDDRYPPGFFAHRAAFSPDGAYGSWLMRKPVAIVIDGTAVAHAGLSGLRSEAPADKVNGIFSKQLRDYVVAVQQLREAGVLLWTDGLTEQVSIARGYLAAPDAWGETADTARNKDAAKRLLALQKSLLFADSGPTWFRGDAACRAVSAHAQLTRALDSVAAQRLVIGHTPTRSGRVEARWGGQIIRVDTGFGSGRADLALAALLIEGSSLSVMYASNHERQPLPGDPLDVADSYPGPSRATLERALQTGQLKLMERLPDNTAFVEVRLNELRFRAKFWPDRQGKSSEAAPTSLYFLDRLMNLNLVLPAVRRTFLSESGSLQYFPRGLISEAERVARREGARAWCPLNLQFDAMNVFNALTRNEGLNAEAILYTPGDWRLMLAGPSRAFARRSDLPRYLRDVDLPVNAVWYRELQALDVSTLKNALGESLDEKQISALLKRRDRLLRSGRKN